MVLSRTDVGDRRNKTLNATHHDLQVAPVFITANVGTTGKTRANAIAPGREFMRPKDMVGGTLFLASHASAMMKGQVMVIDAGAA